MSKENRRRYFVDPQIQYGLLRQAFCYWLWASASFAAVLVVYRVLPAWYMGATDGSGNLWRHLAPYVIASAVLFPIVIISALKFSNRFVGPLVRIRRVLKALEEGRQPEPLKLRDHDYLVDIAASLNRIAERLPSDEQRGEQSEAERTTVNGSSEVRESADEQIETRETETAVC